MSVGSMLPLFGEAVADEIQLDGSRHLTLEASDTNGVWRATLHLVIDEEEWVREGEIVLEGVEGEWSGALVETLAFTSDTGMRLRGRFGDAEGVSWIVEAEDEAGVYRLQIHDGTSPDSS